MNALKNKYIKWLIPIIVLLLMIIVACWIYAKGALEEIAHDELQKTADIVTANLYEADLTVKTIIDYNDISAIACKSLDYYADKNKIQTLLERISAEDYVQTSLVCEYDGRGFDYKGDAIDIGSEHAFAEVLDSFSKGGSGLVVIDNSEVFSNNSIAVVNQVLFMDQTKGFLITVLYADNLAEKIFFGPLNSDKIALVSLSGTVIASPDSYHMTGENFWDDVPNSLPVDTIKLNISQKSKYISTINDYGYVIVVPSKVTNGAVVILMEEKSLRVFLRMRMMRYYVFTAVLMGIVLVFSSMMIGAYIVKKHLFTKREKQSETKVKKDFVTGLSNGIGVAFEIRKYIESSENGKGIMFAVVVDEFLTIRKELGDDEADRKITEFANKLKQRYRTTDIVGRISDSEYFVFMKDVDQEKDIRKLIDELQIFLYDIRTDIVEGETPLNANVGCAIYPQDGSNADELFSAARTAMEKSKAEGNGRISFYK